MSRALLYYFLGAEQQTKDALFCQTQYKLMNEFYRSAGTSGDFIDGKKAHPCRLLFTFPDDTVIFLYSEKLIFHV